MNRYKKLFAVISAALMLCLAFTGCSGRSSSYDCYAATDASISYNTIGESEVEYVEDYASAAAASDSDVSLSYNAYTNSTSTAKSSEDMYAGRKIIRNYDISLTTSTFDDDTAYINSRISEFGGYVLESSLSGSKPEAYGDAGRYLEMTIRVPAEKASDFVSGVETLGKINYIRDYTDDITDEYYDADTRLAVLQEQLERLRAIMVETDDLSDIIELENRISEVMLEIESLTGTLKRYDALIDYTTVYLFVTERNAITGPANEQTTAERISDGFTNTLNGVGVFFVNFFVWFVSSLPVIVIVAIAAALIVIIVRAAVKKHGKKKNTVPKEEETKNE